MTTVSLLIKNKGAQQESKFRRKKLIPASNTEFAQQKQILREHKLVDYVPYGTYGQQYINDKQIQGMIFNRPKYEV